jgi:hypothetical protein
MNEIATSSAEPNEHINEVRKILLDQMRDLRKCKTDEELKFEGYRSGALNAVAATIVSTARVEVDYINSVNGASQSDFLQCIDEVVAPRIPFKPQSPLPSADDPERLGGPSDGHPWRGRVVKNRLR